LPAVVRRYGHRFKIKLGGHPEADLARLDAVHDAGRGAATGSRSRNEQYADRMRARAGDGPRSCRLAARPEALPYLEPLPRDASMDSSLVALDAPAPLLLDEVDGTLDALSLPPRLARRI
jgi:hypothetical protein